MFIQIIFDCVALPLCPELHRTTFPRNEDIGSFLRVNGTVVRTVLPKLLEYKRVYYCTKCKEPFDIKVLFHDFKLINNCNFHNQSLVIIALKNYALKFDL